MRSFKSLRAVLIPAMLSGISLWFVGTAHAFGNTECAADRFGSSLNCTANDVGITSITIVNGPSSCIGGTAFQADLNVTVAFHSDTRYAVGIFLSEDGKSPQVLSSKGGAASCNVAILPTPPFPEFDNDACGDGSATSVPLGCSGTSCTGQGTFFMPNTTLYCNAVNGYLSIPYVVSWDNQYSGACFSIADPVPNTTSKCNTGNAQVAYGSGQIVVLPSITKTNNSAYVLPGDYTTYTITLANNAGSSISNAVLTDPAFTNAASDLIANDISCSFTNGASCPAGNLLSAIQGPSGITIPTMPNGSGLTFTIGAIVNASTPAPGTLNNSAYVGIGNVTSAPATSSLEVRSRLVVAKSFSPASIGVGNTSVLSVTLQNTNPDVTSGVSFTDLYPAGLQNTGFANAVISGAGCTGTLTGINNGTSLALVNGIVPANTACAYSVNVTSGIANAAGYNNSTGTITTANAETTSAASATLAVLGQPTVSKSFTPGSIGVNGTSVLAIKLANPNPVSITGASFKDNYPANLQNTGSANATISGAGCTGILTAANNGTSLALVNGTVPANTVCTYTINVTSGPAGSYTNNTGAVTTANAGTGASASATLTVVTGMNIHGTVYSDANHNSMQDPGESGTGQTVYIKLAASSGGVCANTAISATPADPSTGQYTVSGVSTGNYCLIISANSTLSITSPSNPAGWTGTEASSGIRTVTVSGSDVNQQDFGLYYGTTISGEVFDDIGNGGGTPNDGRLNGQEPGLAGAVMKLTSDSGGTVYDSMTTGASGIYKLYIPGTIASGTYIKVVEANPSGYLSTGADPGNTGGAYDRPSDTIRFAVAQGTVYTGVNFGDVPANQFITDGAQTGSPGTTLTYTHTYTAGSAGTLTFSTTASSSPSMSGWGEVLYQDTDCTGQFAAGDPQITAPISVSAGQKICILMKEFIPAQAPLNAQNKVTVTAQLSYSNANPALTDTQTRTDLTTVGTGPNNGLNLSKSVDKSSVLPGSTITYTITYSNQSASALTNIVINDSTPAYTTFQSASCGTLGTGLTGCLASGPSVGAQGSISWTLSGGLAAGASGTVSFTVQVQP